MRLVALLGLGICGAPQALVAQNGPEKKEPGRRPPPRVQVVPEPRLGASFQIEGRTVLGFDAGAQGMRRPFLYPILGPSGVGLTRMGHPRDPVSHSHHNSVWISHHDLGGHNFWADNASTIQTRHISRFEDGDSSAFLEAYMDWTAPSGTLVLRERRRITLTALTPARWRIDVESELEAAGEAIQAGTSGFGFLGVRMAKTIGVHDGGGRVLNSEGAVNEAGCFRKPARWIDYSGPVTAEADEGITLLDHPQNLHHPVEFHVRDDGWMGASTTLREAYTFQPGVPLRLKYGLLVHGADAPPGVLEEEWKTFAQREFAAFPKSSSPR
jgi:hypothetical protein